MKYLTFAVPSYNSQDYLDRCVRSLLPGGDDVEILIVDDGSTDSTAQIADRYQEEYPNIVRAIHQENGGHGEAVNTGMKNATGFYFKVVDSDDWVDTSAYLKLLKAIKTLMAEQKNPDVIISNFVYEKDGAARKKVMRYKRVLPTEDRKSVV